MNPDELREMLAAYDAAREAAGMPAPPTHALQRDVFVTDDPERDWAMLFPELRYMRRQYGAWSFPQAAGEDVPMPTSRAARSGHRGQAEEPDHRVGATWSRAGWPSSKRSVSASSSAAASSATCRAAALHRAMEGLGSLAR